MTSIVSGLPADVRGLAIEIHTANIAMGWWKQEESGTMLLSLPPKPVMRTIPRNVGELLALVHSEISEADHGYELGLMDDKLPHRRMVEVELADVAIRVLDMLGFYADQWQHWAGDETERRFLPLPLPDTLNWEEWCRLMHRCTTTALEHFRKGRVREGCTALDGLLGVVHFCALAFRYDLSGAIAEKRAFNATRADHKLENRVAQGGKAF